MRRVLVLDGGGALGVISAAVLKEFENHTSVPISESFDLIVGTSVGALFGGILAGSTVPADFLLQKMMNLLPNLFAWRLRIPIVQPKYSRQIVVDLLEEYLKDAQMRTCRTKFLCTSVSVMDEKTHFFKSWEDKDGKLKLVDAINRSYAAPIFFGPLIDKATQTVWMDGGCGNMNCPLEEAFTEVNRQGWGNDRVHILSLGNGYTENLTPFKKAKRWLNIRQALWFMHPTQGGVARVQEPNTQVEMVKSETITRKNLSFQRLNVQIPDALDKFDGAKYREQYKAIGELLTKEIDYTPFS